MRQIASHENTLSRRLLRTLFVSFCAIFACPPAPAINIEIHHDTGDDDNPDWDEDGTLLIATFEAAAEIWEDLLPGPGQHDVDVKWDNDFDKAGEWNLDFEALSHNNIRINADRNYYYDVTPLDHSEFDFLTQDASGSPRAFFGGTWHARDLYGAETVSGFYGFPPGMLEVGYRGRAPAGSELRNRVDLLTLVLHELGHELGINSVNIGPGWDLDPQFVGGLTGIGVRRDGGHLVPRTTLMYEFLEVGTRTLPSALDVLAVAEHHGHSTVDLDRIEFFIGDQWHVPTNWIGGSVPGSGDDAFIRNPDVRAVVGLTSAARAQNLFLGARASLSTHENSLIVGNLTGGTITIDGDDTTLFVNTDGSVQAGNIVLRDQGTLDMRGGEAILFDQSLNVTDNTSSIVGYGTVTLLGAESLINDGVIEPSGGTLTLAASTGEFDLDGAGPTGRINVHQGNLVVNGPLRDAFGGTVSISGGRRATFRDGWELAGLAIVDAGNGISSIDGGTMRIAEGSLEIESGQLDLEAELTTMPGSYIDVAESGSLWFHQPVTYDGGVVSGDGLVVQAADAIVTRDTTIDVERYDWDGDGASATSVRGDVRLLIQSSMVGANAADAHGGSIHVRGGWLAVDTPWTIDSGGQLELSSQGGSMARLTGASLTNNGRVTGTGVISVDGLVNGGTISATGDLEVRLHGPFDLDGANDDGRINAVAGRLSLQGIPRLTAFSGHIGLGISGILELEQGGIELTPTGTMSASSATYIAPEFVHHGTLDLGLGGIRLQTNARFAADGITNTSLAIADVDIERTAIVENGHTFTGSGSVVVAPGGTLSGDDVIELNLEAGGRIAPGLSVGSLGVGGDFNMTPTGELAIEIGGTIAGTEHDELIVSGDASLNGTLDLALIDGFVPGLGQTFRILQSVGGTVSGGFGLLSLPVLDSGLAFDVELNPSDVTLSVVEALSGDFNNDGVFNAADYTVWRDGLGGEFDPEDYDLWRSRFGMASATSLAADGTAAVPEPGSLVLVVVSLWLLAGALVRRRRI